jgi:hypothetical protein
MKQCTLWFTISYLWLLELRSVFKLASVLIEYCCNYTCNAYLSSLPAGHRDK